jgi:hypothetical protein
MPIVDRREFGGRFSVSENSKRLSNYRHLEIQLMEMLGGWCHTTPQLAFKATFGYHVTTASRAYASTCGSSSRSSTGSWPSTACSSPTW